MLRILAKKVYGHARYGMFASKYPEIRYEYPIQPEYIYKASSPKYFFSTDPSKEELHQKLKEEMDEIEQNPQNKMFNVIPPEFNPKMDPIKKEQELEVKQKAEASAVLGVLKRELVNDFFEISLKTMAYLSAPNQGMLFAELSRSCIDALNHFFMFCVNLFNFDPRETYQYGIEKLKNMAAIVPGLLFIGFGCFSLVDAVSHLTGATGAVHGAIEPTMLVPFLCYMSSMIIELTIIFKNVKDASNLTLTNPNTSFFQRIKSLMGRKDPLLEAILYENAITLASSAIPLLFSGIELMVYPFPMLDFLGSGMIGCIELYIAYHLLGSNIKPLLGEGVEDEIYKDIKKIIQENEFIEKVSDLKAVYLSSSQFKVSVHINYNLDLLNEEVLSYYEEIIEYIEFNKDMEDIEDYSTDLITALPKRLMKEIEIQNNLIESEIESKYPECLHIDLEMDHNWLMEYVRNAETTTRSYTGHKDDMPHKEDVAWMVDEAKKYLAPDFEMKLTRKLKERQAGILRNKKPKKYTYASSFDAEDIYEELLVQDEYKVNELMGVAPSREENLFDDREYEFKIMSDKELLEEEKSL